VRPLVSPILEGVYVIDEVWVVDVGDPAYPRTPPPEPFRERMPQLNSAPADLPAKRRNRGRKAMIVQEDRLPAETPPVAQVSRWCRGSC